MDFCGYLDEVKDSKANLFIFTTMGYFEHKTIWITGASSGIGEALTYALNKKGAQVIISSRNQKSLEKVKNACVDTEKVYIAPLDLEDSEKLTEKAKTVLDKFKKIDVLINNGGISQRSLIKDTNMSVYRKLMEVNFFGTIALSKLVLPQMIREQSGHIVVISSLMGKFSSQLRSGYAAAKHALHGFFESLRLEHYDDNIKVLLVCPGFVKTNISLNSVTKDGSKHNEMDEAQDGGLSAEDCAAKIISAIQANKEEVYIGGREISALYMKRFFPKLLTRILKNRKVT